MSLNCEDLRNLVDSWNKRAEEEILKIMSCKI